MNGRARRWTALEQVLRNHGSSPYVHTDQAVEALVAETEKMLVNQDAQLAA